MAQSIKTYAKMLASLQPGQLDGFVNLLKEDGVLLQVEQIIMAAERLIEAQAVEQTVTITSAKLLTDHHLTELKNKIKKMVADPVIVVKEDKSLLSGVKIELPNEVIDGSLAGRLVSLGTALKS